MGMSLFGECEPPAIRPFHSMHPENDPWLKAARSDENSGPSRASHVRLGTVSPHSLLGLSFASACSVAIPGLSSIALALNLRLTPFGRPVMARG